MIDDPATPWPVLIKRIYDAGHQIGSHTWSHQDLSTISPQQRENQIIYNEMAINSVLRVIPTYMRPPRSSCNGECQALLERLGYHITYFDLDTEDTIYNGSEVTPIRNFDGNLTLENRHLVISHDIQPTTANVLTEHMLKGIQAAGLKAVTVGECLNEPPENWYRLANGAPFVPPTSWTRFVASEAPVAIPKSELLNPSRLPTVPAPSIGAASSIEAASSFQTASVSASSPNRGRSTEEASVSASPSNHGQSSTSEAGPPEPSPTSSPQGTASSAVAGSTATSAANAVCASLPSVLGYWLLYIAALAVYCS
jgi:hypothetical protein